MKRRRFTQACETFPLSFTLSVDVELWTEDGEAAFGLGNQFRGEFKSLGGHPS